jgi:hypothetical protein
MYLENKLCKFNTRIVYLKRNLSEAMINSDCWLYYANSQGPSSNLLHFHMLYNMRITTQRYIYKNVFPIRPQVCIIIQKHLDFKVNIITFFAPPFHAATKLVPTTGEELNQFQGNWRGENQGYQFFETNLFYSIRSGTFLSVTKGSHIHFHH